MAARGLDMPNIDWIIQYNTPGSCIDCPIAEAICYGGSVIGP